MRGLRFLFVVFFTVWLTVLSGCHGSELFDPPADAGAAGSSTTTATNEGGAGSDIFATTSSTGGEGGGPACDGACYLWASAVFEDLGLFWIGAPGEAPPCPDTAPAVGAVLHAEPQPSPPTCPACSCSPAGCALPEEMHVSAAKCPGDGAASIAWDSPAWGGACTAQGAIAPGLMCSGVPCTQSLTVAVPAVTPCTPVSDGVEAMPDPVWGLTAQECILAPLANEGCSGSEACLPPPPEGFSLCLYRWGDDVTPEHCPEPYPRHLVMYADHDDTRACEPCSCSDPQGGECSALVSVFTGGGCGALAAAATVSTDEPACVDLPAGIGLGSKSATWLVQSPGSCTSSGGPVGGISPALPLTLCCQEAPAPPAE